MPKGLRRGWDIAGKLGEGGPILAAFIPKEIVASNCFRLEKLVELLDRIGSLPLSVFRDVYFHDVCRESGLIFRCQ
jgi:hypothetical protein